MTVSIYGLFSINQQPVIEPLVVGLNKEPVDVIREIDHLKCESYSEKYCAFILVIDGKDYIHPLRQF